MGKKLKVPRKTADIPKEMDELKRVFEGIKIKP